MQEFFYKLLILLFGSLILKKLVEYIKINDIQKVILLNGLYYALYVKLFSENIFILLLLWIGVIIQTGVMKCESDCKCGNKEHE